MVGGDVGEKIKKLRDDLLGHLGVKRVAYLKTKDGKNEAEKSLKNEEAFKTAYKLMTLIENESKRRGKNPEELAKEYEAKTLYTDVLKDKNIGFPNKKMEYVILHNMIKNQEIINQSEGEINKTWEEYQEKGKVEEKKEGGSRGGSSNETYYQRRLTEGCLRKNKKEVETYVADKNLKLINTENLEKYKLSYSEALRLHNTLKALESDEELRKFSGMTLEEIKKAKDYLNEKYKISGISIKEAQEKLMKDNQEIINKVYEEGTERTGEGSTPETPSTTSQSETSHTEESTPKTPEETEVTEKKTKKGYVINKEIFDQAYSVTLKKIENNYKRKIAGWFSKGLRYNIGKMEKDLFEKIKLWYKHKEKESDCKDSNEISRLSAEIKAYLDVIKEVKGEKWLEKKIEIGEEKKEIQYKKILEEIEKDLEKANLSDNYKELLEKNTSVYKDGLKEKISNLPYKHPFLTGAGIGLSTGYGGEQVATGDALGRITNFIMYHAPLTQEGKGFIVAATIAGILSAAAFYMAARKYKK